MTRNIDGYTYEINEVEDGFSVIVTTPKGNKRISHSYIRTYAIKLAHEIIDTYRRNNVK